MQIEEINNRLYKLFGKEKIINNKIVKNKINNLLNLKKITDDKLKKIFNDLVYNKNDNNLFTKYIIPPFSVLDTKTKRWRDRKNKLDEYFGTSLVGRDNGLLDKNGIISTIKTGTSEFDSLLCEIIYKWFGFSRCSIYDCFAGGHIRGNMATKLEYIYIQEVLKNYV